MDKPSATDRLAPSMSLAATCARAMSAERNCRASSHCYFAVRSVWLRAMDRLAPSGIACFDLYLGDGAERSCVHVIAQSPADVAVDRAPWMSPAAAWAAAMMLSTLARISKSPIRPANDMASLMDCLAPSTSACRR